VKILKKTTKNCIKTETKLKLEKIYKSNAETEK